MKVIKFLNDKFEEYILMCTLTVTVFLIFLQVVMRYIFKNSLSWSEELARYIFLWQAWISTSYAVKKSKHIRVEIINKYFSAKGRNILELCVLVVWAAFSIFFSYESLKLTISVFRLGQSSPAMGIPMGYVYASVPVGCLLMGIRLIQEIYLLIKTNKSHNIDEHNELEIGV